MMNRNMHSGIAALVLLALIVTAPSVLGASGTPIPSYDRWENGPPKGPDYFPIAVWLQQPRKAPQFKQAGINLYIGLWKGPTTEQLAELRRHGMPVICDQNEQGLEDKDDPIIIGWMHQDEPDNAQALPDGGGWGPPVTPAEVVRYYEQMRQADSTRPVFLNLGQAVAWDGWHGRGVRSRHPEDYPEYVKGADIVSFDIYPAVHDKPEVAGKLWYVGRGVRRLREWAADEQPVWSCIECTHISNPQTKATPHQVRCEVWMAIIHGARGIVYFIHEFEPKFNESALLDDPDMLAAVTKINQQIHELAPIINSPDRNERVSVSVENPGSSIEIMVKESKGSLYLFAVEMGGQTNTATFTIKGMKGDQTATVLGQEEKAHVTKGTLTDRFQPWDVKIYRIDDSE